jgi:hypothetical protein
MEARNAPDEARTVLHVAQSFADEPATWTPKFDRCSSGDRGYGSAYVGAAVTEIATFRAELSGPQVG